MAQPAGLFVWKEEQPAFPHNQPARFREPDLAGSPTGHICSSRSPSMLSVLNDSGLSFGGLVLSHSTGLSFGSSVSSQLTAEV